MKRFFGRVHIAIALNILILFPALTNAGLILEEEYIGSFYVSADGKGTLASQGTLRIDKRTDQSQVVQAILMATSIPSESLGNGDVSLQGNSINWDKTVAGPLNMTNAYADVTSIVEPIVDSSDAGIITVNFLERNSSSIDGTALLVIMSEPTEPLKSIVLYTGSQSTDGDAFNISLSQPLSSGETIIMGLGIGYGFQGPSGTNMNSIIDVNSKRLTSSAGGEDDGSGENGALFTVGGIGDSINNPNPNSSSTGFRSDDELYEISSLVGQDSSIEIRTINPSDDDNIFMAYFEISGNAEALPIVDAPLSKRTVGLVDTSLPTIVLTHGLSESNQNIDELWTGFGEQQAAGLISEHVGLDTVNIIQYVWEDAFHVGAFPTQTSYTSARRNTYNAGKALQKRILELLGESYSRPIHFVGHSLGTIVNTYAAAGIEDVFTNVSEVQFTALDRPDRVGEIPFINPDEEQQLLGFGPDFFANTMSLSGERINIKLDNYYSQNNMGVGDVANGDNVYNHVSLVDPNDIDDRVFTGEGVSNNHSGVQQWYRWTIAPNEVSGEVFCDADGNFDKPFFFDETLNPCNKGWYWSITQNFGQFPESEPIAVAPLSRRQAAFSNIAEYGCTVEINANGTRFICAEQSSPYMAADITVPEGVKYIEFDYSFTNRGDGDYATMSFDNDTFWILEGDSNTDSNEVQNSGLIRIPNGGTSRRMKIALFGVNENNASFYIENVDLVTSIIDDDVPDTDADGVPDSEDICPNTEPDTLVDSDGCALEEDETVGEAPTTPGGFRYTIYSDTAVELFWNRSTDDGIVVGYEITRNGIVVETRDGSSYFDNTLLPGVSYTYDIVAIDNEGNRSLSDSVTLISRDNQIPVGPSVPEGFRYAVYSNTAAEIFWSRSTDDGAVVGYEIRRDGIVVETLDASSYFDDTLMPGVTYTYQIVAIDNEGNRSGSSSVILTAGANPAPAGNPSPPSGFRHAIYSNTAAELFWNRSDDDGTVVAYEITRNGVVVETKDATSYFDNTLSTGIVYNYRIIAIDNEGNRSSSKTLSFTTD